MLHTQAANEQGVVSPSRGTRAGGRDSALRFQGQVIKSPGVFLLGPGGVVLAAVRAAAVEADEQQQEQHDSEKDEEDEERSGVPLGLEQLATP